MKLATARWGFAVHLTYRNSFGRPTPPGISAFALVWRTDQVGGLLWFTPTGATILFIFEAPIEGALLHDVHAAASKLVAAWLDRHGLAPLEFMAGRVRPGFTVETTEPSDPIPLPRGRSNGVRRETAILYSARESAEPDALIEAAKLLPEIALPQFPVAPKPRRGLLETFGIHRRTT